MQTVNKSTFQYCHLKPTSTEQKNYKFMIHKSSTGTKKIIVRRSSPVFKIICILCHVDARRLSNIKGKRAISPWCGRILYIHVTSHCTYRIFRRGCWHRQDFLSYHAKERKPNFVAYGMKFFLIHSIYRIAL